MDVLLSMRSIPLILSHGLSRLKYKFFTLQAHKLECITLTAPVCEVSQTVNKDDWQVPKIPHEGVHTTRIF